MKIGFSLFVTLLFYPFLAFGGRVGHIAEVKMKRSTAAVFLNTRDYADTQKLRVGIPLNIAIDSNTSCPAEITRISGQLAFIKWKDCDKSELITKGLDVTHESFGEKETKPEIKKFEEQDNFTLKLKGGKTTFAIGDDLIIKDDVGTTCHFELFESKGELKLANKDNCDVLLSHEVGDKSESMKTALKKEPEISEKYHLDLITKEENWYSVVSIGLGGANYSSELENTIDQLDIDEAEDTDLHILADLGLYRTLENRKTLLGMTLHASTETKEEDGSNNSVSVDETVLALSVMHFLKGEGNNKKPFIRFDAGYATVESKLDLDTQDIDRTERGVGLLLGGGYVYRGKHSGRRWLFGAHATYRLASEFKTSGINFTFGVLL